MGGGGGSALGLLRIDVVQKDLNLTDDQKSSIQKLQDAARDNRTALQGLSGDERTAKMTEITKDQDSKIAGILDDKQKARLKEIRLQARGPQGLTDKELAEALELTDDQVNKIKEIVDASQKEMQDAFQSAGQGGDRTAMRDKMTKLRKDTGDKILAVLTPDQTTSYNKMLGTKIDLPQARRRRRWRSRPGRRPTQSRRRKRKLVSRERPRARVRDRSSRRKLN